MEPMENNRKTFVSRRNPWEHLENISFQWEPMKNTKNTAFLRGTRGKKKQ